MFLGAGATPAAGAVSAVQDEAAVQLDLGTLGRWLSYLGLFLMVGAVAFRPIARRAVGGAFTAEHPFMRRSLSLGALGASLTLVAGAARLYAQVVSLLFPGDPITAAEISTVVFDTTWGTRWLIQMAVAALAGVAFLAGRAGRRPGVAATVPAALAASAVLPLTGHAVAASWHWSVTWPLQVLHVLAGAVWLGSLLVVTLVGLGRPTEEPTETHEELVARLIGAFSPVAVTGVAVVVTAGVILSISYVGSFGALWGTGYGRILMVKIALLMGTGLIGAYNWRRLRPRLGTSGAAATLRFSARVELLLGAVLLLVTALLVALPAPHV